MRRIEEKGEKEGESNLHALARSTDGYHRGCCLILSAVPRPFDHSSPHRRLIRSEFHILPSPAMNQGCLKSALVEQKVPRLSFSGTAATASTVIMFVLALVLRLQRVIVLDFSMLAMLSWQDSFARQSCW